MSELPLRYEITTVLEDGRTAAYPFEFADADSRDNEPSRSLLLHMAFKGLLAFAKDPEAAMLEAEQQKREARYRGPVESKS